MDARRRPADIQQNRLKFSSLSDASCSDMLTVGPLAGSSSGTRSSKLFSGLGRLMNPAFKAHLSKVVCSCWLSRRSTLGVIWSPGLIESVAQGRPQGCGGNARRDAVRALLPWSYQRIHKCDLVAWGSADETTSWASMQRGIFISKQGSLGNCHIS